MKETLRAALLYFALVFGAGFVLAPIRLLWLVPRLGERWAELVELPLMLVVITSACRYVFRRWPGASPVVAGVLALMLMLGAEFGLVLWLRGIPLEEYFATRDVVAGTAYYLALGYFACLPGLIRRFEARASPLGRLLATPGLIS